MKIERISTSEEEGYTAVEMAIINDGETIGSVSIMESDSDTYLERIDIYEAHRNHGYGTEALSIIKGMYSPVYLAPDNSDAKRLYDRIAYEVSSGDAMQYDQGFGVYEL